MCGFIAQLVEHRTGIAKVMGSNPVEALIFFRLLLSNCLNWKIYCDDHTSLSWNLFVNWKILNYVLIYYMCAKPFSLTKSSEPLLAGLPLKLLKVSITHKAVTFDQGKGK